MTNTEKILEEFDEIFPTFNGGKKAIRGLVKSFLSTSIAQALAEDRERVREKVKKLKKDSTFFSVYRADYNEALDDLLSSLPLLEESKHNQEVCCGLCGMNKECRKIPPCKHHLDDFSILTDNKKDDE